MSHMAPASPPISLQSLLSTPRTPLCQPLETWEGARMGQDQMSLERIEWGKIGTSQDEMEYDSVRCDGDMTGQDGMG